MNGITDLLMLIWLFKDIICIHVFDTVIIQYE